VNERLPTDSAGLPPLAQDDHLRPLRRPLKLSILMPVYDEQRTLRQAIDEVLTQKYPVEFELCVVDDGSTDSTPEILAGIGDPRVRVTTHPRNLGKGAAIVTAATVATGTHMVPLDADLEYAAADLPRMLAPIMSGRCEVVFGTRIFGVNTRYQTYQQGIGNRVLTLATNVMFNCYLSDVHTCLKMMPLPLFRALELRETRFGLDSELTARILQLGIRPFEVPVSYYGRSFADGKKITWRDGVHCLRVLATVRRGRAGVLPASVVAPDQVVGQTPAVYSVRGAREQEHHTASDALRAP
jgi:dolichol-phosphate hexosyltransferase